MKLQKVTPSSPKKQDRKNSPPPVLPPRPNPFGKLSAEANEDLDSKPKAVETNNNESQPLQVPKSTVAHDVTWYCEEPTVDINS